MNSYLLLKFTLQGLRPVKVLTPRGDVVSLDKIRAAVKRGTK